MTTGFAHHEGRLVHGIAIMSSKAVKEGLLPRAHMEYSLDQIKKGIEHIHGLGSNIVLDGDTTLVIINFDSSLNKGPVYQRKERDTMILKRRNLRTILMELRRYGSGWRRSCPVEVIRDKLLGVSLLTFDPVSHKAIANYDRYSIRIENDVSIFGAVYACAKIVA
ncbi:hypothetical protein ARMGADRAFT_1034196 [Armillaria gallica]|uniref:Uncharacterized protein n=1 Tax=Armillaria gallica TaxID=47427 RepID=A0A2H3CZ00_ARMGA|nr:hypothetical protein ARMGADRAFT_1034196 [Armillaria gallica]